MGFIEDFTSTPKKIGDFCIFIIKYLKYILYILLEKVKNIQDFLNDPYNTYKKTLFSSHIQAIIIPTLWYILKHFYYDILMVVDEFGGYNEFKNRIRQVGHRAMLNQRVLND